MEINGDVTDAGRTDVRTDDKRTREDRATQPMDAGWLSFAIMKYQTPSPHSRQQFPSLVQRCFLPDPSCLLLARRRKEGLLLGKRKKGRRKEELWSRHFHPLPVALALRSGGYPSLEQYQIPNLLPLLFSTICSAKQGKVDARAILPSFPSPD